jgi:hypothetical protein
MSTFASFYIVNRAAIPHLLSDTAHLETAYEVEDAYLWSGYAFTFLMEFLMETGALAKPELTAEERQTTLAAELDTYVLPPGTTISADLYDEAGFIDYLNKLDMAFPEAANAGSDGVEALVEHLGNLAEGQALLIVIG